MKKLLFIAFFLCFSGTACATVTATTTWKLNDTTQFTHTVASITLNSSASLKLLGTALYSTTNPTVYPFRAVLAESLTGFIASFSAVSPDTVKFDILIDAVPYFWNSSTLAWVIGSSTYTHTSTAAQINASFSTLISTASWIVPRAWLHSTTGTGTPRLFHFSAQYTHGNSASADTCTVVGYVSLGDETIPSSVTVTAIPEKDAWINGSNIYVLSETVTATPNAAGYFSLELIRSSQYETTIRYRVKVLKGGRAYLSWMVTIPNQSSANLENLVK